MDYLSVTRALAAHDDCHAAVMAAFRLAARKGNPATRWNRADRETMALALTAAEDWLDSRREPTASAAYRRARRALEDSLSVGTGKGAAPDSWPLVRAAVRSRLAA
jgi:hypothetical protein